VFNLEVTPSARQSSNKRMSNELAARPICPACNSSKVGTLAKEITAGSLWRCASCGETFKAATPNPVTTVWGYDADFARRDELSRKRFEFCFVDLTKRQPSGSGWSEPERS
jgi:ribosomal protein L37AE/L43A